MSWFRRDDVASEYDPQIAKLQAEMMTYDPDQPEYKAAFDHFVTLTKLKAEQKPKRVSADTMAIVAGNLLGILIVVAYEQKHVMTSRAPWNTLKPK